MKDIRKRFDAYEIPQECLGNEGTDWLGIIGMLGSLIGWGKGTGKTDGYSRGKRTAGIPKGLEKAMQEKGETFFEVLSEYIDRTGRKDSDIYKPAMIDKATFSKIRNGHIPKRASVLRLALVLKLTPKEATRLMSAAGYAFNRNNKFDKFICFFLTEFSEGRDYSWIDLNDYCYEFTGEPLEGID